MKRRFLLLCGAALFAGPVLPPALAETRLDATGHGDSMVEIASDGTRHRFTVEIADDATERARGLMFRRSMAEDAGMLFVYPSDRVASFWMKNTYIPLDMLFIANDGTILQIAAMTEPHSLMPVRSDAPVRAVLEINGGLSEALGIAPGDTVTLYRRTPAR